MSEQNAEVIVVHHFNFRWQKAGILILLLIAAPAFAQDEGGGSDFVIGLNALNTQIQDALAEQPTRRVALVPFNGVDRDFPKVSRFIADQLITALASRGDYSFLDAKPLADIIRSSSISPLELAATPEFRQLQSTYENSTIIVGTITDLGSKVAIMARLINADSGRFTGGAMVYLAISDEFAALVEGDRPGSRTVEEPASIPEQKPVEKEAELVEKPQAKLEAQPANQPKPQQVRVPDMAGESDEAIYTKAMKEYYESGQYSAAITLFERLVDWYPDSVYADNAIYWIGEANYSLKRWNQARQQFQRVLDKYPYGNKVPSATLKRGYAEEKMGRLDEAIFSMEEVIRRFGTTPIADQARAKLQELRALKQSQETS